VARRQDLEHGEGIGEGDRSKDARRGEIAREHAQVQVCTEPEEQQDAQLQRPASEPVAT
jgi:hypothetical protein